MFRLLLIISVALAVIIGLSKLTNREEAVGEAIENAAEAAGETVDNAAEAVGDIIDGDDEADQEETPQYRLNRDENGSGETDPEEPVVTMEDLEEAAAGALEEGETTLEALGEDAGDAATDLAAEAETTLEEVADDTGAAVEDAAEEVGDAAEEASSTEPEEETGGEEAN